VTFKKDYQLEGPTTIVFYQQLMSACDKAELKIKRQRKRENPARVKQNI